MKKLLLFLLFSVPVRAFCQCEFIVHKVDEFEKLETILTKPVPVFVANGAASDVFMALARVDTVCQIIFSVQSSELVCVNAEDYISFMFSDSTVSKLKHAGTFQCSKRKKDVHSLSISYECSVSDLEAFQDKYILKARATTSNGFLTYDFSSGNKAKDSGMAFFKNHAPCLLKK